MIPGNYLNTKNFFKIIMQKGGHRPVTGCKWDGGLIFQFGTTWWGIDA